MTHPVSDHANAMHRGPHHDHFIHAENKESVKTSKRGSHGLGDKNHIREMMGEPHGADVAGHHGKMKW